MIGLVLASVLFAQETGAAIVAVKPEDPTTWSLEYPALIEPYIADYYNCLKSRELFVGDGITFEIQHRDAIPQCTKMEVRSFAAANAALAKRGRSGSATPQDVAGFFETIRKIHIARGKDLDVQLAMGLGGDPYQAQGMGPANEETQRVKVLMLDRNDPAAEAGQ